MTAGNFSPRRVKQESLGLDEQLARSALRPGRGVLLHQRAVGLCVDTGAAGVNELLWQSGSEPFDEVSRAVQIDFAVFLLAAFAGGNRVHHPIERAVQLRACTPSARGTPGV